MIYGVLFGNDFDLEFVVEVNYLRIVVAVGRFYQVEKVDKNIPTVIGLFGCFFRKFIE